MQQQEYRTSEQDLPTTTREVIGWASIDQPGFYVSRATGLGYRVTAELLTPDASPALSPMVGANERFMLLSNDPHVRLSAARRRCAGHRVAPKF